MKSFCLIYIHEDSTFLASKKIWEKINISHDLFKKKIFITNFLIDNLKQIYFEKMLKLIYFIFIILLLK